MARKVTNVNWLEEMAHMSVVPPRYDHVAIHVHFLCSTPREASDAVRYAHLKSNVDATNPIRLEITFADSLGCTPAPSHHCWEFSVDDLDPDCVSGMLRVLLRRGVAWVTFDGLHGVAHLLKLVTCGRPLPETLPEFAEAAGRVLGDIYDTKVVAEASLGGEWGLARLAEALGVRVHGGRRHRARCQSLLTARVFAIMRCRFDGILASSRGVIYGVNSARIFSRRRCGGSAPPKQLVVVGPPPPPVVVGYPYPPPPVVVGYPYHPPVLVGYRYHPC